MLREIAKPVQKNKVIREGKRKARGDFQALSVLIAGDGWDGLLNSRHFSKCFCAIIKSLVSVWGFLPQVKRITVMTEIEPQPQSHILACFLSTPNLHK